jgi:hypothetical protein
MNNPNNLAHWIYIQSIIKLGGTVTVFISRYNTLEKKANIIISLLHIWTDIYLSINAKEWLHRLSIINVWIVVNTFNRVSSYSVS